MLDFFAPSEQRLPWVQLPWVQLPTDSCCLLLQVSYNCLRLATGVPIVTLNDGLHLQRVYDASHN